MAKTKAPQAKDKKANSGPHPPGRIKIARAMRSLLEKKDFNSITTAEIARESGASEALIYRYFSDKRGLLFQVLADDLEKFNEMIRLDIKGIRGALNKLRKLIWSQINYYHCNRIPAKILLLEVRSHPDYFQSDVYNMVKEYSECIAEIVSEGVENGEIRDDISRTHIRRIILGGIEYLSLSGIIQQDDLNVDQLQEDLCSIIFDGITKK
jgi:AcrR family transcriptional regulator